MRTLPRPRQAKGEVRVRRQTGQSHLALDGDMIYSAAPMEEVRCGWRENN